MNISNTTSWLPSLALALTAAIVLTLGFTPSAHADSSLITRVDFLGWSGVNPDAFCIRVRDAQKGNRLEVRQIGIPTPTVSVLVTPETERQVFLGAQFAPWSCVVPALPGAKAPNGWLAFGQLEGGILRIGVSNGRGAIQIGLVQARPDPVSGKTAKASLKTAYWSSDSLRVIVIINQLVKGGAWGLDVDEAHGFKVGK